MEVPMDNRRTLTIGDKTYELEASLGTGIVYANEFRGNLEKPYRGALADDMLQVYARNQLFVTRKVKVDKKGNVALNKLGEWTEDENGEERKVVNPDYVGPDIEALLRITWAMARAAGSTSLGYGEFFEEIIHQPAGVVEEASIYNVVIIELGGGIIFRRPTGHSGAQASDEEEAEE